MAARSESKRWQVTLGEDVLPSNEPEQLAREIEKAALNPEVDLIVANSVTELPKRERWLYRLLGVGTQSAKLSMHVVLSQQVGLVTLLDEDFNERRMRGDTVSGLVVTEPVRFKLATGGTVLASPAECLSREQALQAALEFLAEGRPPSWLREAKAKGA